MRLTKKDIESLPIQIGSLVTIKNVNRPDRDAHVIGKTGEVKKFEKTHKGIFCHLLLTDGEEWCAHRDNIVSS